MPAKTLPLSLVQEMIDNYKAKQLLSILTNKINPMKFDAKSVWFDLETLKSFVNNIELEAAKHPEYDLKNFGVRIYYAAYPEKENWDQPGYEELAGMINDPVAKDYEKLHTVIAVPTAEINGANQDFDPLDEKTYDGTKPTSIGSVIMAENHGELVPPGTSVGNWF